METSTIRFCRFFGIPRSRRSLLGFSMPLVVASLLGCRICPDTEDMAYPAYGGAWERTVRDQGRVGSLFDPAGARSSTLVDKDVPPQPDEIERMRDAARDDGLNDPDEELDPFSDDAIEREDADDADNSSGKMPMDPGSDADNAVDELDNELQRRRKELRGMELQDIQVIPGEPLPPIL